MYRLTGTNTHYMCRSAYTTGIKYIWIYILFVVENVFVYGVFIHFILFIFLLLLNYCNIICFLFFRSVQFRWMGLCMCACACAVCGWAGLFIYGAIYGCVWVILFSWWLWLCNKLMGFYCSCTCVYKIYLGVRVFVLYVLPSFTADAQAKASHNTPTPFFFIYCISMVDPIGI